MVAPGAHAVVCTPLAMHGGSAPPLVVPATANVRAEIHPSFAGFDIEIDGHNYPLEALDYRLSLHEDKVTLVSIARRAPLTAVPPARSLRPSPGGRR